ncbi:MAG: hypothetical protein WAO02_04615 [Verrucomicrobiia bacterium]
MAGICDELAGMTSSGIDFHGVNPAAQGAPRASAISPMARPNQGRVKSRPDVFSEIVINYLAESEELREQSPASPEQKDKSFRIFVTSN